MVSNKTTIINATGLHARPASAFVMEAKKYQSDITIKNAGKEGPGANAKSVMMLLMQGLSCGTEVEITCEGPDEQEALDNLIALIDSGFGE